jgi:alpha-glucosidase
MEDVGHLFRSQLTTDDVADYRNVDPRIGTLEDFNEMNTALKAAGIKVIVDVVPNHCSNDHVWFQDALKAGKGSEERRRFHFYDGWFSILYIDLINSFVGIGPGKDQPPQDWQCTFGGPAWSPSGTGDGQWYLHSFDSSQPDWNWDHPDIVADFLKTIKFWADRGVSGFRVDVADSCKKQMDIAIKLNAAERHAISEEHSKVGSTVVDPMRDLDEVLEVYKGWRKVFNQYDPPITYVSFIRMKTYD